MKRALRFTTLVAALACACGDDSVTAADACDPNPCLNAGTCTADADVATCACADGFEGTRCERRIDACDAAPCQNGGACVAAADSFVCVCPLGFAGLACETNADDCEPNPCFNGGECADTDDGFLCNCAVGFEGVQCETNRDDCSPNPCENGGICIDKVATFACVCAAGFEGATCDLDIDDCAPSPCFHGGICTDGVDAFACTCAADYWGSQCEAFIPQLAIATQAAPAAVENNAYVLALGHTGGSIQSMWSIVPGGTNDGWLTLDPATGMLSGTPTTPGPVSVTVRIEEPVYSANFAEETLAFQVLPEPPPAYTTDFDQVCPNGWTLTGAWECGVPIGVGPATAFSGSQCLATTIDGGYPNLQTFASATATSPAIALPTAPGLRARFRIWIDTEGATYDGVNLQVSVDGGASFAVLNDVTPAYGLTIAGQPAWGGHQGALGWQAFEADLAAYAGQSVHLRFAFQSDSSGVFPGVYLDDFSVAY